MKKYLFMAVLLTALSAVVMTPANLIAAEKPAASVLTETIYLNQATAEELQVLPGVGPALSERIVAYRVEHGPFETVDQLAEVKGIGQAKLDKFREHLKVN